MAEQPDTQLPDDTAPAEAAPPTAKRASRRKTSTAASVPPPSDAATAEADAPPTAKQASRRKTTTAATASPPSDVATTEADTPKRSRRRKSAETSATPVAAVIETPVAEALQPLAAPSDTMDTPVVSAETSATPVAAVIETPVAEALQPLAAPSDTMDTPVVSIEAVAPPKAKRVRRKKPEAPIDSEPTADSETATTPPLETLPTIEAIAATETPPAGEPTVAELQAELGVQLEAVVERVQEANPDFSPPPFTPAALIDLVRRNLDRLAPRESLSLLRRATQAMGAGDLLDADTWKGLWYMLNYTLQYQGDILKRRLKGDYYTDPYGYDPEFNEVVKPFFDFLFRRYWRVTVNGIENIPDEGAALLVSNHSGVLPWDGAMIAMAVQNEHPNPRLVRALYANWFPSLPFLSMLVTKMGMVLAHPDNGRRLLKEGELVLVFPEGYKGPSKLFKDRYRLQRFGRGGAAQLAIETGAPVIPVAVIGSEEIYPVIGRADVLGKPFGIPYVPITPLFPWTGLLGAIPLPSKWSITFDTPIDTTEYRAGDDTDTQLVNALNEQIRERIQATLYERLKDRKSIFFG